MIKVNKNSNGFSVIEIVIILLVVAIIGVSGWLVYKNHHKTNTASVVTTPASKSDANTKLSTTSSYVGWSIYTNSQYGASLKYPDGWNVQGSISSGNLILDVTQLSSSQISGVENNPMSTTYNNDLEVFADITTTPLGGYSGGYSSVTGNVLNNLTFNGSSYPVIGVTDNGSVTSVALMDCKTNMNCTNWVPTSSGGSVDATISSVNDQQAATVPINLNSNEYNIAYLILASLKI